MGKARQVIIGNSAASLSAIKAIREVDRSCPITLLSAENCNAYSPVLTTYYLKGRLSKEGFFIVDSDFYRANGVETLLGNRVVGIDPSRQTVYLDNGRKVEYDNLLIATGASPVKLDGSGDRLTNVFSLRTIADAERIAECARTAREVVLIGAGLIGLQVGDALFREGTKLTVMEWAEQVLPETADADCAAIVQKELDSRKLSVRLGERVKQIKQNGKKVVVTSASGELVADMVVVAVGVRPNIELVNNSGIKVNRGILVDETMRTNISNIFAAGDVSEGENLVTGRKEVLPNWNNACKQGRIAGLNMAGCQRRFEGGLRETITTIFGLTIAAIGLVKAAKDDRIEEVRFANPGRKSYRKLLFAGNRLVGTLLLGRTEDASILKTLIMNRKDVSSLKEGAAGIPLDMRKMLLPVASR